MPAIVVHRSTSWEAGVERRRLVPCPPFGRFDLRFGGRMIVNG
jgi:hypothetical protein